MFRQFGKIAVAAGAAATIATGAMIPRPASADTTSTLLTAAAVVGGIVLYNNYQHKRAAAAYNDGYNNGYYNSNGGYRNYSDHRRRWRNENYGDNGDRHYDRHHSEDR